MELIIYYNIIYNGIIKHPSFLATHFYRESKIAESNHVTKEEFFKRLEDASELFKENMNQQYLDQLLIDVLVQQKRDKELLIGENVIGSQFSSPYSSRPPIYYSDTWGVLGCNLLIDIHNAIQDAKKQGTSAVERSFTGDEENLLDVSDINDQIEIIKIPSPNTANKGEITYNPYDRRLLEENTIKALYDFCIEHDFFKSNFDYSDFFNCFNLSKPINVYPKFKHSHQQNFVLIISGLIDLIGRQFEERFNISSYSTIKDRIENDTKPSELKAKMKAFVKRYKPGIKIY
jgi:hypothetical protein